MTTATTLDFNLERSSLLAVITHEKGSWKWQNRFAKVRYEAFWSKRQNAWLWKLAEVLDDKVTPRECENLVKVGYVYGGKHNRRAEAWLIARAKPIN